MVNNPEIWNQSMWKMEKTDSNDLTEDLLMLGGHGMLVDSLKDETLEKYKELGWNNGLPFVIDDKLVLYAGYSDDFVQLNDTNVYTYYQMLLDNDEDEDKRFGIFANGLLVETPSEKQFHSKKWLKMD
jgi:hypothetical protein